MAVLAVAVVVALTACTTESGQTPYVPPIPLTSSVPTSPTFSRTSQSTPPTTRSRPRDLTMSGIRPCDLLTADQQRKFGVDDQPRTNDDETLRAQSCYFDSQKLRTKISVSPLTRFGIERFQPREVNGEVRPLTIRAFPAVEVFTRTIDTIDRFCVVVVDVAPGQAVHVNYGEDGLRPHLDRSEVCRRAVQVADVVVENLEKRSGDDNGS
ncbi:DUF3558 domain-containing protein [Kibdelosporangium aridum]|uniref:DUF3558 domain-containing protein n=1 Tax=Kibdelosporangium aridum TaxID=2030 RepID=UPI00289E11F4|nr:DUF3558 domain-containing protein [Kibdelosporangium aridum]